MPDDADLARKLFGGACEFVAGAASLDALPESQLPEVAFAGRSNVGKSSLINALTNRTALARVSHTPGRTRQINLFCLRDSLMLADLPGYGFARVSKAEAQSWNELITSYLHQRMSLRRVVLLLDARRGIMDSDRDAMGLLDSAAVAFQLVLTKADALKDGELKQVCQSIAKEAQLHPAALQNIISSSAKEGRGIGALRLSLAELAEG
jgi:GTP-binding protein